MFNEDSDDDECLGSNKFADFSASCMRVRLQEGLLVLKPGASYTRVYTVGTLIAIYNATFIHYYVMCVWLIFNVHF